MRALKTLLLIKLKVVPGPICLEEVNTSDLVAKVIQCICNQPVMEYLPKQMNIKLKKYLTIAVVFTISKN